MKCSFQAIQKFIATARRAKQQRVAFGRLAQQATEYTRIITTLSAMFDLRPSVTEQRWEYLLKVYHILFPRDVLRLVMENPDSLAARFMATGEISTPSPTPPQTNQGPPETGH